MTSGTQIPQAPGNGSFRRGELKRSIRANFEASAAASDGQTSALLDLVGIPGLDHSLVSWRQSPILDVHDLAKQIAIRINITNIPMPNVHCTPRCVTRKRRSSMLQPKTACRTSALNANADHLAVQGFDALRVLAEQFTLEQCSSSASTQGVLVEITTAPIGNRIPVDLIETATLRPVWTYRVRVENIG